MTNVTNIKRPTVLAGVASAPPPERLVGQALSAVTRADHLLELAAQEIGRAIDARWQAEAMIRTVGVPPGHEVSSRELADRTGLAESAVARLARLLHVPHTTRLQGGIALSELLKASPVVTREICRLQGVDAKAYEPPEGNAA